MRNDVLQIDRGKDPEKVIKATSEKKYRILREY